MCFNSHINQLSAFLIYFSTLAIHVKSADSYDALHFDFEDLTLIDMKQKIEDNAKFIRNKLAVACPAHTSHEKDFNRNSSHGKNCLFVNAAYEKTGLPSSTSQDTCEDVYKMSISYHKPRKEFVFGYEVYHNSKEYKRGIYKNYEYADFVSIEKANLETNHSIESSSQSSEISPPKLTLERDNDEPSITLGFLWIIRFRLKFDIRKKRPIQVIYTLSKGTEMGAKCSDYSLGDKVYKEENKDFMNSLYDKQVDIFKKVKIPDSDSGCDGENNCLTKYSLIPAEEFRFSSPEPKSISCSNLITVPIWRRTVQGVLEKLDKFLYALAKVATNNLTVFSGVQGQLEMPKGGLTVGKAKISLSSDKSEMPVPNIIYKAVKYEFTASVREEGKDQKEYTKTVQKAVIIAIHNNPRFDANKNAFCPIHNCKKWGWGEILNEGRSSSGESSSNKIYCCPIKNGEIMKKLGMPFNLAITEELNLTEFPVYEDWLKKIQTENIEEKVLNEMNTMFGETSTPEGRTEDTKE